MNDSITLTTQALARVLEVMYKPDPDDPYDPLGPLGSFGSYVSAASGLTLTGRVRPRDDDPGPWGPIGPIIRTIRQIEHLLGPFPEPWRLALTARSMIEQAVAQHQWAQVLAGEEGAERSVRVIGRQLRETVNDWCGTPPGPRWPFPWPPPFARLGPVDLLLAGLQFQRAAAALGDHPLRDEVGAAADQLMRTALERLDSSTSVPAQNANAG